MALFSAAGLDVTRVQLMTDRDTGASRGFGFVEFAEPGDVEFAIEKFDGQDMDGRRLAVQVANPRPPRTER